MPSSVQRNPLPALGLLALTLSTGAQGAAVGLRGRGSALALTGDSIQTPAHLAQFVGKDGVLAQSSTVNKGLFRSPSLQEMFAPEAVGYGRKLLQAPALAPAPASAAAPKRASAPAPAPEMMAAHAPSHAEAPSEHQPTHENSSETIVHYTPIVIVSRPVVVVTPPSRPRSGKGRRLQNATPLHESFIRG